MEAKCTFAAMKTIENTLVPDELKTVCFACNVAVCKGACCVEGDAGAPLTEEEISILEDYTEKLLPFLNDQGLEVVQQYGMFDWDQDGNYVTPLVNDRECAFALFSDEGIALCAIEKAWQEGVVPLRKPESCHLYPLRLSTMPNGMTQIVYHRWPICEPALEHGTEQKIPMIDFLREALIRKFGQEWYDRVKER